MLATKTDANPGDQKDSLAYGVNATPSPCSGHG